MSTYDYRACSCGRLLGPCPIHTPLYSYGWTNPSGGWTTLPVATHRWSNWCEGRHCAEHPRPAE